MASVAAPHDPYQLTSGKKSSSSPRWSPDGKELAFLSDRDGKKQIYLIVPTGGEARQVSKAETAVIAFKWMPDGKSLVYTAADADTKALKDRKDKYGEFEIVKSDYQMNHLWLQPLDGKATQLTKGADFSVTGFSISPDGARIAFGAAANPTPGSSGTSDLYTVGIVNKTVQKIVDTRGPESNPVWSPDGSQIAFQTANGAEFYFFENSRIAVVAANGGTPKVLTAKFDEDPQLLAWNAQGIYFEAREKTASYLFQLDPATGNTHRVGENDGFAYTAITLTPDGKMASFLLATPTNYPEVFASATDRFQPVALTALGEQVKNFTLARREVISWKSKDGATIEGVLLKPADFDPTKKYPLLVVIHGGPTGIVARPSGHERNYPIDVWVAKGALVLEPNYRGCAGYGEKFRSLNVRNLGVGDAWDVLSGVDSLIAQGFVDPNRDRRDGLEPGRLHLGVPRPRRSDRFKAISVGAGISDWMTYYVNTDITPFTPPVPARRPRGTIRKSTRRRRRSPTSSRPRPRR